MSTICLIAQDYVFNQSFDTPLYIKASTPTNPDLQDGLYLGQGILKYSENYSVPVYIPSNRPTWAIAIAVAWNMQRNKIGRVDYPQMGTYLATATRQTGLHCRSGLTWDLPFKVPNEYDSSLVYAAQIFYGCFHLARTEQFHDILRRSYPERFRVKGNDEQEVNDFFSFVVEGLNGFETSVLLKMYTDFHHYYTLENLGGWALKSTFDETADEYAFVKTMASYYNTDYPYSPDIKTFFIENQKDNNCWSGMQAITAGYPLSIGNFTMILNNDTLSCGADGVFDSYYDAKISLEDVNYYISLIDTLYPEVNWKGDITPKVATVFNNLSATKDSVNFSRLGPVIDVIVRGLPNDIPKYVDGYPLFLSGQDTRQAPRGYITLGENITSIPTTEEDIIQERNHSILRQGSFVDLEIALLSNPDTALKVYWYDLADTTTILDSGIVFSFIPKRTGTFNIGAKLINSFDEYLIGCDIKNVRRDIRNVCGYQISIEENQEECSFSESAFVVSDNICSSDREGSVKLTISRTGDFGYTLRGNEQSDFYELENLVFSTDTIFVDDLPPGTYLLEVWDTLAPGCHVRKSFKVGSAKSNKFNILTSQDSIEECKVQLVGEIENIGDNNFCNYTVRVYDPVLFEWEDPLSFNIYKNGHLVYNNSYNTMLNEGVIDPFNKVYAVNLPFRLNREDSLHFEFYLESMSTAQQLRSYKIEVLNQEGYVVFDQEMSENTLSPDHFHSVGYFKSNCLLKDPNFSFDWNTNLENEERTALSIAGQVTVSNVSNNYVFTAENPNGCVFLKDESISSKIECAITGTAFLDDLSPLIYPNPTSGIISIQSKKEYFVQVYSSRGELISGVTVKDVTTTIDLSLYKAGFYYLKFNNGSSIFTEKVILL